MRHALSELDKQTHPIQVIDAISKNRNLIFEFSLYSYTPRAIEDERQIFKVAAMATVNWFDQILESLPAHQDVAFHSRVYDEKNAVFHVPMIDFKDFEPRRDVAALNEALLSFGITHYSLYQSGRSYHLYGLQLLTHERWLGFLGRILLLNLPDKPEVVDTRWVGHRLMGGYGTLRWTKNNPHYKAMPKRFELT